MLLKIGIRYQNNPTRLNKTTPNVNVNVNENDNENVNENVNVNVNEEYISSYSAKLRLAEEEEEVFNSCINV